MKFPKPELDSADEQAAKKAKLAGTYTPPPFGST